MSSFFSTPDSVKGANNVPAPRQDSAVNAPPPEQHKRVADFVKEAPDARYSFDSRRDKEGAETELCRATPGGGRSCIKSAMMFKSMQALSFYCALPAEPHRTDMECSHLPR